MKNGFILNMLLDVSGEGAVKVCFMAAKQRLTNRPGTRIVALRLRFETTKNT